MIAEWIVLTPLQRATALTLNNYDAGYLVNPREVTSGNEEAYALPVRVVEADEYRRSCADLVSYLEALPRARFDSDVDFFVASVTPASNVVL